MSSPRFVHLRVHSDFSMINGITKVKPLVKACVKHDMVAMALTDFTNFCGLVRFYGEALSSGVKPIVGADVLVKSDLMGDERFELTLLAKIIKAIIILRFYYQRLTNEVTKIFLILIKNG